jgi:hypothetical protein
MNAFSRIVLVSVCATALTGCSHKSIGIRLVDQSNGQPVVGALIQRDQPVSLFDKILDPVGTHYHPLTTAESLWTDANGSCEMNRFKQEDVLRVYVATHAPLTVTVDGRAISLLPGTNTASSLLYSVWQEEASFEVHVAQPKWDWQKPRQVSDQR